MCHGSPGRVPAARQPARPAGGGGRWKRGFGGVLSRSDSICLESCFEFDFFVLRGFWYVWDFQEGLKGIHVDMFSGILEGKFKLWIADLDGFSMFLMDSKLALLCFVDLLAVFFFNFLLGGPTKRDVPDTDFSRRPCQAKRWFCRYWFWPRYFPWFLEGLPELLGVCSVCSIFLPCLLACLLACLPACLPACLLACLLACFFFCFFLFVCILMVIVAVYNLLWAEQATLQR